MTTENQQMLAALGQLHDDIVGKLPQISSEIAALAGAKNNLAAVVSSEMNFVATIDPDDPAPTNVRGGVYNTIAEAINDAPFSALVSMKLAAGKTHAIDGLIKIHNKALSFRRNGVGANPIIQMIPYVSGVENSARAFSPDGGNIIHFDSVDIALPTAKADDDLPWGEKGFFEAAAARPLSVGLIRSTVSGGMVGENLGLCNSRWAAGISLGFYDSTIDGPLTAIIAAGSGVSLIKKVYL